MHWSRDRRGALAAVAGLVAAGLLTAALPETLWADGDKPRKPRLELRASPRMGFSPLHVLLTAELTGGDDIEEYHCLEIEWDWDDGGKSMHEEDCAPFEEGVTKIQRRFTATHDYRRAGIYNVKATMRRSDRTVASSRVRITVRPGLGDPTLND